MKLSIRKFAVLTSLLFAGLTCQSTYAQIDQLGKLLTGGKDDAIKLSEAYLSPFTNAFGATLNSGWYNTARPHRFPGFDLTLSLNVAIIPDGAKSFDVNALGLSSAASVSGSSLTPTIAGSSDAVRPELVYTENVGGTDYELARYRLPEGTGLGFIPAPTLQLGIGLPLGTDIIGRFVPTVNVGDVGSIGLWGVGIKHSLKQYIPVVEKLPVLNLSVMAGYTKFYTSADLDFSPEDVGAVDNTTGAVNFNNQVLDFSVSSFTANIVVSADIPFFTAYGGLGINSTATNLKMTGWYPVPVINPDTLVPEVRDFNVLRNPVDAKLSGDSAGIKPRITAGVKLKLAVLHIHFDYTYSNYSVIAGGLGISFR